MSKKSKNATDLKVSEQVILIVSSALMVLSFVFTGTPFLTFSWAFVLIVAIDLAVLFGRNKLSESVKRGVILLSILGGLLAVWTSLGAYFPWLFH